MLPVITAFMAAHQLPDVTVVADAGMISEANQKAIEDAGLSFILGTQIPDEPYAVAQWRREHPGQDLPDGQVFTQPWPATGAQKAAGRRDKTIYYQYRADRGRRTLRGIDEQVAKAEKAVAGLVPVKRNRFITLAERPELGEPGTRGQGPCPGRAEGLHHQPGGLPGRHPGHRRVRDRRLPPACGGSRKRSGCPSTTCRPGRSTTTSASPSTPT